MILITGAAGFIGSRLAARLNESGRDDLVLCDDFSPASKLANHNDLRAWRRIARDELFAWTAREGHSLSAVFHLGARTDTTEQDVELFERLNTRYSQELWVLCSRLGIPFIYASSAATYGDGSLGFSDDPALLPALQPLNPYGWSKHRFDLWAMAQAGAPPRWYGLKFFNVYGPHENHKGRMASVVYHAFRQIEATGGMKLFRSHRPDIADGEQKRDFIFVEDVLDVMLWLWDSGASNGIYNLGAGQARSFFDLTLAVFRAMEKTPDIQFIDIPADIREAYQYYTQADMQRLRQAGYTKPFCSLEHGVEQYVKGFLLP